MQSVKHGVRTWLPGATALMLLSACLPVAAQVTTPDATTGLDSLESQLAARSVAISADTTLDPATRDATLVRLRDAQKLLQAAAADRAETARVAAEREAAPARLTELAVAGIADDASAQSQDVSAHAAAGAMEAWSSLSLAQLEIETAAADNLTRAARQQAAEYNRQLAELRGRRPLFGADLAAARDAVTDVADEVAQSSVAGRQVGGTGGEQLLARARQQAREARLALLEELSSGADVREQLLSVQASAAEREVKVHDERLQALRAELARRRLAEAVAQTTEWQQSSVGGYEAVAAVADSNRELAGMYGGASSVTQRVGQVQRDLANLEHAIAEFGSDTRELRARLDGVGRTLAAGVLIRQGIEQLPSVVIHQRSLERRRVAINEVQLRIVELAGELRRLERDLPGESARLVDRLPGLPAADRDEAIRVVSNLLEARQRVLQPLLNDLDKLQNGLVELQARERVLLQDVQDMDRYLRSREPWVRNGRRVALADLPAAIVGLAALPTPQLWAGSATAVAADVAKRPQRALWAVVAVIGALAVLLALRHRQGRIAEQGTAAMQRVRPAVVLGAALLNGLAWLSLSAAVGWWLAGVPDTPVASQALGRGLLQVTPGLFMAGFMHALFSRSGGAGSVNPALAAMSSRFRPIVWYLVALLGVLVVSRMLWVAGDAGFVEHGEIGARLSLLIAALLMALGIRRARSRRGRNPVNAAQRSEPWTAAALHVVAVTIPLLFVALLVQGFTIAAYDVARALIGTLLVLIVAGTVRVLFLAPGSGDEAGSTEWSSLREGRLDLLHVMLMLAVLMCLAWIWRDVFSDLLYLQHVPLWTAETAEGLKTVTVANLLSCLAVLAGTLLAFWALPLIVVTEATDSAQRSVGTRYAVIALVRYSVLIVGLVAAFSLLNIGWSKLQWMAAGLSVGLGFGLQETAANFFSGLTLLSERSIRVGDLVTVGDKTGIVRRIKVRATTVEDFDGREIVIPNRELVSTQVTNWTLTDSNRRLQVVVGVAYGSDTTLVVRRLLEAADGVEGILATPSPQAVFEQFGDSALQFRLYVWIDAARGVVQINHDLHMRIDELFRASGIDIDFPQRDVHLFPAGPFEVRLRTDAP